MPRPHYQRHLCLQPQNHTVKESYQEPRLLVASGTPNGLTIYVNYLILGDAATEREPYSVITVLEEEENLLVRRAENEKAR